MVSICLVIQPCMRVTPLGFCLGVIVNKQPLYFEKTTYCVLSVLLLIYGLGGRHVITVAAILYISDISTPEHRTLRFELYTLLM
jgi:hypothetical protein